MKQKNIAYILLTIIAITLLTTGCVNTRDLIGSGDEKRMIHVIAAGFGAFFCFKFAGGKEKASTFLVICGVALFIYA